MNFGGLMDWVKKNAKAIVTFIVGVIIQAVSDILRGGSGVDITSWQDWLRYIALAFGSAILVWLTGNKLDLGQILKGTRALDTHEQAKVASETLNSLPNSVGDEVVNGYQTWTTG